MTEQEIVDLGTYCEGALGSPYFQLLLKKFKQSSADEILATLPGEKERREHLYLEAQALNSLEQLMGLYVTARDQIAARENREPID